MKSQYNMYLPYKLEFSASPAFTLWPLCPLHLSSTILKSVLFVYLPPSLTLYVTIIISYFFQHSLSLFNLNEILLFTKIIFIHLNLCSAMEKFKNNEKKKSQKCLSIKVKVEIIKEQIGRHA